MRVYILNTAEYVSNADISFKNFLLNIENGSEKYRIQFGISKIKLPTEICITPDKIGLENLIKGAYPELCKKNPLINKYATELFWPQPMNYYTYQPKKKFFVEDKSKDVQEILMLLIGSYAPFKIKLLSVFNAQPAIYHA